MPVNNGFVPDEGENDGGAVGGKMRLERMFSNNATQENCQLPPPSPSIVHVFVVVFYLDP